MRVSRFVLGCRPRLAERTALRPCRLAILRSFTVEPLVTMLQAGALVEGIDLDVHVSGFNTYAQDILNPASELYRSQPDAVLLAVLSRDLGPALTDATAPAEAAVPIAATLGDLVASFRRNSHAPLLIQGLETPAIDEGRRAPARLPGVAVVNQRLAELAHTQPAVHWLDYQALIERHGVAGWNDERNWVASRLPLANASLIHLAHAWLRFVVPIAGRSCKALVTDLDNTLWGGVVGEEGPSGVVCAADGPGQPFHALQQAMLELRERGIVLAIASQNNPEEAMAALRQHPGMVLRPQHFSAMRIDWQDKAANVRSIAEELDIGLDSVAFVDDDPMQLERVRTELPEVHVIELPADPERYAQTIRDDPVFARLALSSEDVARARYYAEQQARRQFQEQLPSLEDFYRSLEQHVVITRLDPATAQRAAQLTQKTNQFNLTTKRYTTPQILDLATRADWRIYTLSVGDRFGDSGLTGLAIVHDHDGACEIDTLLLSCRIIGRTIETALLAFLIERARRRGSTEVRGRFVRTARNGIVEDLYRKHGFVLRGEQGDASEWTIDPARAQLACPSWIHLTVAEGASA